MRGVLEAIHLNLVAGGGRAGRRAAKPPGKGLDQVAAVIPVSDNVLLALLAPPE